MGIESDEEDITRDSRQNAVRSVAACAQGTQGLAPASKPAGCIGKDSGAGRLKARKA